MAAWWRPPPSSGSWSSRCRTCASRPGSVGGDDAGGGGRGGGGPRFFGDPTATLRAVGITGTNGKTTTAFLVRHLLEAGGRQCGLLGTGKRGGGGGGGGGGRPTPEA